MLSLKYSQILMPPHPTQPLSEILEALHLAFLKIPVAIRLESLLLEFLPKTIKTVLKPVTALKASVSRIDLNPKFNESQSCVEAAIAIVCSL